MSDKTGKALAEHDGKSAFEFMNESLDRVWGECLRVLKPGGFDCLPMIHWFKPTNAPNKFMGSGTLPSGAYVTLEHEYILVFRKGGRRSFLPSEQGLRRESAFFWEERNSWFSDVWNFSGAS